MTGIPMSGVIGGPLSGWILHSLSGAHGLAGWQWLFLLEALPSLVMGIAVIAYLDNGIKHAKWLSAIGKGAARGNIAEDSK